MKHRLLFTCLLLLVTANCKKKEVEATLSGRLLATCNGQPLSHATITFRNVKGSGASGETIKQTTTDESGNFSITYKSGPAKMRMYVNGNVFMTGLMAQKDIHFGDLYTNHIINIVLRIKANNAYSSSNDTLIIVGPHPPHYILPTPINDTVFAAQYFTLLNVLDFNEYVNKKTEVDFLWHLKNNLNIHTWISKTASICNASPDTIDVVIN